MYSNILLLLQFLLFSFCQCQFPFMNVSLSWEDRVDDLVSRLTLQEMADQMAFGGGDAGPCPPIERLNIPPYNFNTECLRGVVAPNEATAFPIAIAMAATFSYETMFTMAEIIGTEARGIFYDAMAHKNYNHQKSITCFSPFINIMRHPLWGRVQEIFGEDPFLTKHLTEAYVKGMQGNHPRYIRAISGCKTLAAGSGPDNIPASRFSFNSQVSERDLRLTYLPMWKTCIEAGALNIMCSYNSINGIPACGNKRMMNDIARKEFGFTGYMVSDLDAIRAIFTEHHYTSSVLEAVALAVNSGLDLELPVRVPAYTLLKEAVMKGLVEYQTIVQSVNRLFYARMRLGLFDPPSMNPYASIDISIMQSPMHRRAAIDSALKSFVLLKNKKLLPVKIGLYKSIAVVGPMANNLVQLFGLYSPAIAVQYSSTPYEGIKDIADKVTLAPGCGSNSCPVYNSSLVINATIQAEFVIVCLGTGQELEGEGNDRGSLDLPINQIKLLNDAIKYAKIPVLLLLFTAGPVTINDAVINDRVGAIMQCFMPAQSAGAAVRAAIFYDDVDFYSPAGRLPYTWPSSMAQVPAMVNYSMEGRTYRYFDGPGQPLFPFGYGLSYANFQYKNLQIVPAIVTNKTPSISISVDVYNQGPFDSDEVIQVYIKWNSIPVEMPKLQLVGFQRAMIMKVSLPKTIQINVSTYELKIWTENTGFVLYPGVIDVFVGGQQPGQAADVGSNVLHSIIKIQP